MRKAPRSRSLARRPGLSRDKILQVALALADDGGMDAVSMRQVAEALGVKAMSLYKHVANKTDLLDGLVELVASEWSVPADDTAWQKALRERAYSVRENLIRHPWAATLIEARSRTGPTLLRHHNSVIGVLRRAGFSVEVSFETMIAMNSYIYGYVIQEHAWFHPKERPKFHDPGPEINLPADYPYILEMMNFVMAKNAVTPKPPRAYFADFDFALDMIIQGLEKRRT